MATSNIVEATIKTVEVPEKARRLYWDSEIPGFGLRVNDTGRKSFFVNYRVAGRQSPIMIGRWPTWPALRARNRAKELRQEVDRGGDPAVAKRERREAPTMAGLAERYQRDHVKANKLSRPTSHPR